MLYVWCRLKCCLSFKVPWQCAPLPASSCSLAVTPEVLHRQTLSTEPMVLSSQGSNGRSMVANWVLKEVIADTCFNSWGTIKYMPKKQPMTMNQSSQEHTELSRTASGCMTGSPLKQGHLSRLRLCKDSLHLDINMPCLYRSLVSD